MALVIWLFFGLAVIAQGLSVKKVKDDDTVLEWPSQFKLKAKRMSLTSHVVEDCAIWRTSNDSRIDYNNGYVKYIVNSRNPTYPSGVKYEIHPEASEDQEIKTVCTYTRGSEFESLTPETILPDVNGFTATSKELMNDKECTKFIMNYDSQNNYTKATIWAEYDDEDKAWIPVRFEVLEFNRWLGLKDKHEIWDYYDYSKKFSSHAVFNVQDYNCAENVTDTLDSEDENKQLLFIDPEKDKHVEHVFAAFKNNHKINYTDAIEHAMRRSIFKSNLRQVIEHNRQNLGYKLSINQFADKSPQEMNRYMGISRHSKGKVGTVPFPYSKKKLNDIAGDLPKEHDLRLLGLVTSIKNQERCSAGWAFATTAAVEGALARINGGRLMTLSNQALIDCAWGFGTTGGCRGGTEYQAYKWMMEYGLPTEAEYGSYIGTEGICKIKNMTKTFPIRGYTNVPPNSIGALKVALLNHGPVHVEIDASSSEFILYSSGIYYNPKCTDQDLRHGMTLVGYGERDGDTFWILKNSWGPSWGIGGYMYISARDNNCGVLTKPTYVVF